MIFCTDVTAPVCRLVNPYSVLHSTMVLMPARATFCPLTVLNIPRLLSGHCLIGTSLRKVPWEHARCCTRVSGCFSLLEALNRSQVSTLFLDVLDVLHISFPDSGQPVTMLELCQTFHDAVHDCSNCSRIYQTATIFFTSFPSCSMHQNIPRSRTRRQLCNPVGHTS